MSQSGLPGPKGISRFTAPPIVESKDAVYYNDAVPETKADAQSKAVVFSNEQIQAAWQTSDLKHLQLISTNKKYKGLPRATWDAILALHQTIHPYTPEFFDCDSFSAVFLGFTVWNFEINGVVRVLDMSASHSYNGILVASDDGKTCSWEIVEPQADIVVSNPAVTITKQKDIYTATSGFAITA